MNIKMTLNDVSEKQTYREVLTGASSFLSSIEKEAFAAEWLLRERFELTKTELIRRYPATMEPAVKEQYLSDLKAFANGLPVQYIIGHEWFYDRKFKVTSDTLIPRPETEEWFDRYLKRLSNRPLKVLDVGTGTGVLAISHKLQRPQDEVTAVDISPEAIAVAQENAARLQAEVAFLQSDLTQAVQTDQYDLIISNPPYISYEEQADMDESVLEHEPKLALFAEEDGLAIYRRLAEELPARVKPKSRILMEIGFRQGHSVKDLFSSAFQEADVEVWKDMAGHDRVVYVAT